MSDVYIVSTFALLTCLASLLGIWLVFGNFTPLIRIWIYVLLVPLVGALMCLSIAELEFEWLVMAACISVGVAIAVGTTRCLGFRIVPCEDAASATQDLQFSIWQMLAVITLTAGLLGAVRFLYEFVDNRLV